MVRCDECGIPCCDFCIYAVHEEFELNERVVIGGPIGCNLHKDEKHQNIAEGCGYCDDFHCFRAEKINKNLCILPS